MARSRASNTLGATILSGRSRFLVAGTRAATFLAVTMLLAGCAASSTHVSSGTKTGSQQGQSVSPPAPLTSPTPTSVVTVSTCCTAVLPTGWSAPALVGNDLFGASDAGGTLSATWQVIGPADRCPIEPPAFTGSLLSPTHPSGDVIIGVDSLVVSGKRVTVYVTTPSTATPHFYQYVNADVVLGASCINLGADEFGVASPSNLKSLLRILATTRLKQYPILP